MEQEIGNAGVGRQSKAAAIRNVLRVIAGNFVEMFDFLLFGFYAPYIARAFFPSANESASLMLAFMTFGAGFLVRPLGAVILGSYIDRVGRRRGLVLTLAVMATGIVLVALTPSHATIGLAAPLLVLVGRLLQGFSAGVEPGGVAVYLGEMATPGHRGFYVAWQSASQQAAIMAASVVGFTLSKVLPPVQIEAWGWRIPFVLGCTVIPVLIVLRRSLQETPQFLARRRQPAVGEMMSMLAAHWRGVFLNVLLGMLSTTLFYTIAVYAPTFGRVVLGLSLEQTFLVAFCIGLSNLFWLPIMGALSDRTGRKPLLVTFSVLTLVSAYPAMAWLVSAPSFAAMLGTLLWLSFLYGGYNGTATVVLTEVMPSQIGTTGAALAYSLTTAIFGGFTPAITTWLIHMTGNQAAPALWISCAAVVALTAALVFGREIILGDRAAVG